jgi:AraC-like DNA-binding protein
VLPPGLTLVQRGMDYIRRNARRDISVDDVATFLGVSRRLAYLRFDEFAKMSIRKAIVDARLGAVKQMLSGTRLTIGTISRECGFDNPNGLKMLFKREVGMTMKDWRRQSSHNG